MLESVKIEPKVRPTHTIIWLHGLGADGHDFAPIVPELQLGDDHAIRFIFPHAPVRPVTIFGGMPARAWFDIFMHKGEPFHPSSEYGYIEAEINEMRDQINTLINQQIQEDILPENIYIGGFSQGGSMAVYSALTSEIALGGLIGLSTFFPDIETFASKAPHRLPVFIAHGTVDDVVPFSSGVALVNGLKTAGFDVSWHSYPIAHGVGPEEINALKMWLEKLMNGLDNI